MASTRSLRPASSAHPSHLYRSYPKLGIAGRHQLRDLIDQADEQPAWHPASDE